MLLFTSFQRTIHAQQNLRNANKAAMRKQQNMSLIHDPSTNDNQTVTRNRDGLYFNSSGTVKTSLKHK